MILDFRFCIADTLVDFLARRCQPAQGRFDTMSIPLTKIFGTPVGGFISMGLHERRDVENWRAGRIACLEQVVGCNLSKASRILCIPRLHAADLNLQPSMTVYKKNAVEGILLRFSKSGEKNIAEAYSRHFVRLGKPNVRGALDAKHEVDAGVKAEL